MGEVARWDIRRLIVASVDALRSTGALEHMVINPAEEKPDNYREQTHPVCEVSHGLQALSSALEGWHGGGNVDHPPGGLGGLSGRSGRRRGGSSSSISSGRSSARRARQVQDLADLDDGGICDLRVGCDEGVEGDAVVVGDLPHVVALLDGVRSHCSGDQAATIENATDGDVCFGSWSSTVFIY